ncbi:MAG: hypothetical protein AAFR11_00685 [Pseudomonadota bacterium]
MNRIRFAALVALAASIASHATAKTEAEAHLSEFHKIIRNYDFTPFPTPQNRVQAGTVIAVTEDKRGGLEFDRLVCRSLSDKITFEKSDIFVPEVAINRSREKSVSVELARNMFGGLVKGDGAAQKSLDSIADIRLANVSSLDVPTKFIADGILRNISKSCFENLNVYLKRNGKVRRGKQILVVTRALAAEQVSVTFDRVTEGSASAASKVHAVVDASGSYSSSLSSDGQLLISMPLGEQVVIGANYGRLARVSKPTTASGVGETIVEFEELPAELQISGISAPF